MQYRDLIVWQKSMDLVVAMYAYTKDFPVAEQYGLTSQMRRAAISIPSNIAEGSRRRGKDNRNFLIIAYGSGAELETQCEAGRRLRFGDSKKLERAESLLSEIMRMLNTMVNKET